MTTPGGSRRWLVLVAMTGSLSMIMLDQTVVAVALPSMTRELTLSPSGQQWTVNAYVLAIAALVALGGRVADVLGRVRAFRAGVTLFFLASAACALVPSGPLAETGVIAARALQGAGAALMIPVSATIVIAAFSPGERGRAMALYAGISQVFLALGPLVGGLLTEYRSWRAVFLLNVPVGLATLVLVSVAGVPNRPDPGVARPRLPDVALLVGGLALATVAFQQVTSRPGPAVGTLVVGAVALAGFVVRQRRAADPLLHLRLLRDPGLAGDVAVMALVQFGLLGLVLYSSVTFQEVLGLGPMQAGLAALPLIVPLTLAAQAGGRWYDRAGVRAPVLTGTLLCTVGATGWALALPATTYLVQVPGMVLVGIGLGLTLSPGNTDALARVSDRERSQASGLTQTARQLGGTVGLAVVGAVVLGLTPADHAPAGSATAVAAGFGVVAVAFAAAATAAALLLSRRDGTPVPADAPTRALSDPEPDRLGIDVPTGPATCGGEPISSIEERRRS